MGQSADHALGRSRRTFAKGESAFGTFAKPSATDAFKSISPFKFNPSKDLKFLEENRNTRGRGTERIEGNLAVTWDVEAYLKPSGSAGTAPDVGELIKRAMGTETVTGGTKVDYTLSGTQALGSLSLVQAMHDGATSATFNLLEAAFGAWIESMTIKGSGKEEPRISFEGGAANYAMAVRCTSTAGIAAAATTFTLAAASAFALRKGAVIKIGTDDNSGAGYEVTDVGSTGTAITFTPGLVNEQVGATTITPFAPSETTAGSPVAASGFQVSIDATNYPVTEFELTMKNAVSAFDDEANSNGLVSDFVPGEREVSGMVKFRARRDHLIMWAKAWSTGTHDLLITFGTTAGRRCKVNVDFAQFDVSALEIPQKEEVIVPIPFVGLESAGNDEFNLSFD